MIQPDYGVKIYVFGRRFNSHFIIFRVLRLECVRSSCWMSKEVRETVVFVANGLMRKHFDFSSFISCVLFHSYANTAVWIQS